MGERRGQQGVCYSLKIEIGSIRIREVKRPPVSQDFGDWSRTGSRIPIKGSDSNWRTRIIGFERRGTIAFHCEENTVVIDRILYGGRDLGAAFG